MPLYGRVATMGQNRHLGAKDVINLYGRYRQITENHYQISKKTLGNIERRTGTILKQQSFAREELGCLFSDFAPRWRTKMSKHCRHSTI